MKKYIIKVTYLEGRFKGTAYFLNKGGYVVTSTDYVWQDTSYALSTCKAVCTRREKQNTADAMLEKRIRDRMIAEGKTVRKYPLYEMKKYEPYEIDTVD